MNTKQFCKSYLPTILTCLGGVGTVFTAITAATATPKALKLIKRAEEDKTAPLTKCEKIKVAAPTYIPTVLLGISTLGCIFGSNAVSKYYQASLVSAYTLIDSSYKEYKSKLKELYGAEAHEKIVDAIAAERATDVHISSGYMFSDCDLSVEARGSEPKLFYDEFSKRYFESTIEQVLTAEYHLNRNYVLRGSADLNELYEFLGLKPTEHGSTVGWAPIDEGMLWIEFNHHKTVMDDGLECYILELPFAPSADYWDYWDY